MIHKNKDGGSRYNIRRAPHRKPTHLTDAREAR